MNNTKTVGCLIIGSGIAGVSAAASCREHDKDISITILTRDSEALYTRIRLPEYLAGTLSREKLFIHNENWYREKNITLELNCSVDKVNTDTRTVHAGNRVYNYEKLLIATGANPFVPPIPGSDLKGVHTVRTIEDVETIKKSTGSDKKIVAIGGGLLGLEMMAPLVKNGADVTVVEMFDRLLPRQLDSDGGAVLKGMLSDLGFKFRLGAKILGITGDNSASGVSLEGGETLPADVVIISAGVRSETTIGREAGLKVDKGIVVDNHLQSSVPGVYAAGDCAEHNGIPYGLWTAAEEQAKIAGSNMAGVDAEYHGTVPGNTLKVSGISLLSAGEIDNDGKHPFKVEREKDMYRKIVFDQHSNVIGAVLVGDVSGRNSILKAIREKKPLISGL